MTARPLLWTIAAAAALGTAGAKAQVLSDPTRPPATYGAPSATSPSAADEPPPGTQLQSVLLSRGRKLAVINGTTVPLGGMVGEAKLVKITETEVTLKKGDETEVLKMFPGVEKRPTRRGRSK